MGYIGNAPYSGLVTGDNVLDGSIKAEDLAPGAAVPSQTGQSGKYLTTDGTNASWGAIVTGVRVTGITYPGNDTAVAPAGGQTVTLAGSGFVATPTVFVDGTIAPSVSFVSSSQITFTVPAKSAGTYHVYVVNPDGSTAIFVNGISYSGVPTWSTAAGSLGTYAETFSIQLVATGDAPIVYTLTTGSTLPAGVSLSSSGLISGTLGTEQTFSFSVDAVDAQNQETPRSFSVTVVLADPYFEYNALLLSGDGANGAQNNTFLDSSTNAFSITRNGNTTQGTFSPFSQTGWGNYFDGSGDYLSAPSNTALEILGGSFAIEFWMCMTSAQGNYGLVSKYGSGTGYGWFLRLDTTTIRWYTTATSNLDRTYSFAVGTWYHIAVVSDGTTGTIYVNGTAQGATFSTNGTQDTSTTVQIGRTHSLTNDFPGYISNLRIVKGTAVYTANFTPPTAPLTAITNTSLLTCQSNRFVDNSTNAFAITRNGDVSVQAFSPFNPTAAWSAATYGGSGYFDGSGDYLDGVSSTNATNFGTSDFTVECWVYFNSVASQSNFIDNIGNSTNSLYTAAGGSLRYFANSINAITGATLVAGQWYHIAVVRSSGTTKLYVNGVQSGSNYTDGTNYAGGSTYPRVGAAFNASTFHNGYIADVRCVKSAVYTTTFTPPTAPLTAIANTSYLLSFTNGAIYDATSKNDLETVGNAQISTTQSKFGGSSMYFDGTGDWLVLPPNPPNNLTPFGTGDFTVEFWVRFSSFYDYITIVSSTRGANGFNCGSQAAAQIVWYANGAERVRGTTTLSANTWYHIAFVRYSGTLKGYVNGVQEGTTYADSINYSTPIIRVGCLDSNTEAFTGYLQDVRITRGIARYTSNFTPPTTAFKLR
jgi:hypothetical protein